MLTDRHPLPSRLQLPPGPWTTVLDGLCARFPAIPREVWVSRFARGRVQDEAGRPLSVDAAYRTGMEIRYFREVEDESAIPFVESILHADDHLLVVDKPHFLPVTPAGRHVRETLLARLIERRDAPHLVPLHRLDRDTAGLVMFSTCPATRDAYAALFRERRVAKHYEAIAAPLPEVAFPLTRRSRLVPGEPFFRMCEVPGTANSETPIDVIARGARRWRYALSPVTGRKHQLRVHMAGLGAPIENDPLYPRLAAVPDADFSRPLHLWAKRLAFTDPLSGAPRVFESRLGLASIVD